MVGCLLTQSFMYSLFVNQAIIFSLIIIRVFRGTSIATARVATGLGTMQFGISRGTTTTHPTIPRSEDSEKTYDKDLEAGVPSPGRAHATTVNFASGSTPPGSQDFSEKP